MRKRKKIILSIVIPCLNEEKTIRDAIFAAYTAAERYFNDSFELIVADNGSTDNSLKIVRSTKKAKLVKVPIRGYGAALHWGILNSSGVYVFFADADMSYDFYELGKFMKFLAKKYDLVLGSRFKGKIHPGAMPFLNRYIGTPILTFLIRKLYGINTTDSNSGMRLVKKSFYEKLHMRNSGMEWDSELLIKTSLNKGRYAEVPISLYKDKRGSPPRLSRFTDGWRNLKTIVLIKPNSLLMPMSALFFTAIALFNRSFSLSFLFFMLAIVLAFSLVAAKMLNFAINKEESKIVRLINKLPLVFIVIMVNLITIISFFYLSDNYLKYEIVLAGTVILLDMWIFLIETIKTHLINPLPEKM